MKTIKPYLTSWSYIVNQNGNAIRISLEGYGSCTPYDVLQEWLDKMPQDKIDKWADECDITKDIID